MRISHFLKSGTRGTQTYIKQWLTHDEQQHIELKLNGPILMINIQCVT